MRTHSQRLLSMVLALSMLLTFLPVSAFADDGSTSAAENIYTYNVSGQGTYTYTLNADDTATLTKFTGTDANVPEEVTKGTKTYKVTAIGANAFAIMGSDNRHKDNKTLQSVKLPDTITDIGDHAFASCEKIQTIKIPDSVTEIETGTFGHCYLLNSVKLPINLTTIGDAAFSYCSALTSIKLPEGLTTVGDGSFCAAGLTNITVPKSLKKVGQTAFWSIPAIDTVTYTGTLDQWEALTKSNDFAKYNDQLLEAPHFTFAAYSTTPATPTTPPQQPGTNPPESTDKPNTDQTTPSQKPDDSKTDTDKSDTQDAPAVEEDDTAAIGYAAAAVTAAFVGWGAYRIGSEVYLKYLLPKDVLLPQNRIQLAELLWEDAGRPAPADAAAYTDVDANDADAQQAARWAVENVLLTLPDTEKPEEFAPYRSVSYAKSARAWNKAQQLKENAAAR